MKGDEVKETMMYDYGWGMIIGQEWHTHTQDCLGDQEPKIR